MACSRRRDGSHRRPRDVLDALGEQGGRRRLGLRSPVVVGVGRLRHRASGRTGRSRCRRPTRRRPAAWCVFVRSAKRFRVRPWTSHSSQSGFDRSSCWEKTRAAMRRSWSSEPGAGSAEWRTWYSRLKVGIVDPEGPAGLRRRIGELLAEAGYQAIAGSGRGPGGPRSWAAGPSKIMIAPTCMWLEELSFVRNETSIELRRSRCCCAMTITLVARRATFHSQCLSAGGRRGIGLLPGRVRLGRR